LLELHVTGPAENEGHRNLLVETDLRILEMVQKELSQEYLRLMTRSIRASAQDAANDPTLPQSLRGAGKP
jgi:hypothetical protein